MSRKHYEGEKPIDPETQARRAAAMRKYLDRDKRAREGEPQDMNAVSRRIWAKWNSRRQPLIKQI